MELRRVAGISVALVMTSAAGFAQQRDTAQGAPASITERTYIYGGIASSRIVERRSESNGREIVVVTEEQPGGNGRWVPVEEVVTSTVRPGSGATETRREVFAFDVEGRRRLVETTESTQQALAGSDTHAVEDTWVADINGGRALVTRWVDDSRTIDPDLRRTESTMFRRGINGSLEESERTIFTERRIEPAVVRREGTQFLRDLNGRWAAIEARSVEVRTSASGGVEEETIRRPDPNGRLVLAERIVTRRSDLNGEVVAETYSQNAEGIVRTDGRLGLSRRLRRTTSTASDGGRSIVEEVEARSRVAPGDGMRIVQRTVIAERGAGSNRLVTERQVFERDVNGRLARVLSETEEAVAK
jgi:hypothetical protein